MKIGRQTKVNFLMQFLSLKSYLAVKTKSCRGIVYEVKYQASFENAIAHFVQMEQLEVLQ